MGRRLRSAVPLVLVGFAAPALACASAPDNVRYGPDYDIGYVPRYTPEEPPRCPYEEVGMLRYGGRLSQFSEGAERVEQRRRWREIQERNIRTGPSKYDADGVMTTRAGHLLFIRFADRDCLE